MRSYRDGGEHYDGQIGDEPTPAEFVEALLEVTRECVRVLKDSGSLWVNLGDKYSRGSRPRNQPDQFRSGSEITFTDEKYVKDTSPENSGITGKSLMGIPWRYAIACVDELGLILRQEIIWSKGNGGLPESVHDRARRNHEHWFHFTLKPNYYSNMETLKEGDPDNPDKPGRVPGSIWNINTQPLQVPEELGVGHWAAYPIEWPRRVILGWTPESICTACGEGRRPKRGTPCPCGSFRPFKAIKCPDCGAKPVREGKVTGSKTITIGEMCGCPDATAPVKRAVVLDPFGGTGTTALVAKVLGRDGISLDMSADYCRIGQWRTNDEKQIDKVIAAGQPAKQKKAAKAVKSVKVKKATTPSTATPADQTQFSLFDTVEPISTTPVAGEMA